MIRKYYEYEGLGGGINPKSTSNAQPITQQTMTKEQTAVEWIADRFRQYQIEGYKCNWDEVIETVLLAKEIEQQEVAKEREKAKKLMEAVQSFVQVSDDFNAGYINRNGEITRCGIAALSLALTAAEKRLRISLTEYEKL